MTFTPKSNPSKRANISNSTTTSSNAQTTPIFNTASTLASEIPSSAPRVDPFSHNHGAVTKSTLTRTKVLGLGLISVVAGVYGYTVYSLKQEDFSDVNIPDSIKEQRRSASTTTTSDGSDTVQ